MKKLHKTALVTLFVAAAGYASAQTNLSEVNLSGIKSISTNTEVVWDSENPVVNKSHDTRENNYFRSSEYRKDKRTLANNVAEANIAIDKIVGESFTSMLKENSAVASKLTSSSSADAHFKVSVAKWGLQSSSRHNQNAVKPVIALRVDLVDRSGNSLWHSYQRVDKFSSETDAYKIAQLYKNTDSLEVAFGDAVDIAVDHVQRSL
jgi:hypothetical protein